MIEFDEKKHQYKVDGKIVPSVTDILEHLTAPGYGKVNPSVLEEAKDRGTAVHELTEQIDMGFPPEFIDPYIEGYIVAYMKFLRSYEPEWEYIEHQFYEPLWGFCGTVDRVGEIDGQKCVLDIKTTSSPSAEQKMAVCCQTAAYAFGIDLDGCDRYALYLHSDGTFDLLFCADYEDERGFDGWELFRDMCKLHQKIGDAKKRKRIKKEDLN